MKYFDWDEAKNAMLHDERGIGFEEILTAIDEGFVLADVQHPNKDRYPSQSIFIVVYRNYVYLVPYVEDDTKIFLKTIIPSRKATKKYLEGGTL